MIRVFLFVGILLAGNQHTMQMNTVMQKSNLTERETEVLLWVMEGKTSWEIGRILSISERTVKFHLSNIYRKFGVTTRAQAIVYVMKFNLLPTEIF